MQCLTEKVRLLYSFQALVDMRFASLQCRKMLTSPPWRRRRTIRPTLQGSTDRQSPRRVSSWSRRRWRSTDHHSSVIHERHQALIKTTIYTRLYLLTVRQFLWTFDWKNSRQGWPPWASLLTERPLSSCLLHVLADTKHTRASITGPTAYY